MNGVRRLGAVGLLALLAGCTGTSSAGTQPSGEVTTPATAVTTPAVLVPVRPQEKKDVYSAAKFVEYFWALYDYAYKTYDTAPLKAISDSACKYCASTVASVENLQKDGARIEGYEVVVDSATSPPDKIIDRVLVVAFTTQKAGKYFGADGKVDKLKSDKNTFDFGLAWSGSHWSVHGVDIA